MSHSSLIIQLEVVEPHVEFITPKYDPEWADRAARLIEECGRVSHKSEGRIGPDTALPFIRRIAIDMKHESIIEHSVFTVCFIGSRSMSHQLVRHRIAAFTQECVSGDTVIRHRSGKNLTIRQLYERSNTPYGRTHNKTLRLRSVDEQSKVIRNKMRAVFHKGKALVYQVTTKLGYTIKTTSSHRFLRPDGSFCKLKNLSIGDDIMVNGRPCLIKVSDSVVQRDYECLSPAEMAGKYGVNYRVVVDKLHNLGIFKCHKNDKNPEKYSRNHTSESYQRGGNTRRTQYESGTLSIWNKGLSESHPSVKKQADGLRKHHHDNQSEEGNSHWKGGISRPYGQRKLAHITKCELCRKRSHLEVHHLDTNPQNNRRSNIIKLCVNCHNKLHRGWWVGCEAHPDRIVSIVKVGVEEVYDIEMTSPFNNYVANGFVVHNSQRYCDYANEGKFERLKIIIPPSITYLAPGTVLYQEGNDLMASAPDGSMSVITERKARRYLINLLNSYADYKDLREDGVLAEDAREVLPNATKTEVYTTFDLREWRHVMKMRLDKHAQWQIKKCVAQVRDYFKKHLPILLEGLNTHSGGSIEE